ncbi:MAG: tetratricopeptide repeat protein, partial [Deltaproteobacteria bacterium]|nr:tetratricopeptide repeat protein [Deltaproteobacteria bacterium]
MKTSKNGRPGLVRALCAALLVALAFSIYFNSLEGEFVYDDNLQIVENPWITDLKYLPSIFSTHSLGFLGDKEHGRSYRPMVFAVYMAEYAFFGLRPWGWHLVNVILHAINGVMVFFVLSRLLEAFRDNAAGTDPPPASYLPPMAGAVIFTAHTINNEAVAWVSCVPELVYTLLCLSAFYLHMRAAGGGRTARAALTFLSALLFLVAMMAKEPAIALPAFVFLYEALRGRGAFFSRLLKALPSTFPYAAALVVYFVLRTSALGGVAPGENMYPFLSAYQYLLNGMVLFVKYMRVLVLPVGLYPFQIYDPVSSIAEPRTAVATAAMAIGAALLYVFRKRLPPLFFLAAAFIIIPLLPALYIPGLSYQAFAERYLYFSTIGYGLIIALAFDALAGRTGQKRSIAAVRAAAAVFVIATGLYSWGVVKKNPAWRDDITLWSRSEEGSPENFLARFHVGTALAKKGRPLEAIAKFNEAMEITAKSPHPSPWITGTSRMNLAHLYSSMGRQDLAASH